MRLPSVMGIVLCDEFGRDPETGRPSLRGVFNSWHFEQFPTQKLRFTVYAALYDGVGEGKLELSLTQMETEAVIYRIRKWVLLPGRMKPFFVILDAKKCMLPAPGKYLFRLYFDNNELTSRYIDAIRH